jgi:hypothetical protein
MDNSADDRIEKALPKTSRMEVAGWGLGSLLPLAVANNVPSPELAFLGWFGIILGLAIAVGRVSRSRQTGVTTLLALAAGDMVVIGIVTQFRSLELDPRCLEPATIGLLPVPLSYRNPSAGDSATKAFVASMLFATMASIAVRSCLSAVEFEANARAVVRAVLVFGCLMVLHFACVPQKPGWQMRWASEPGSEPTIVQSLIGIYTLLLVYAGFYIALFYDLTGKRKDAVSLNREPEAR